MNTYRLEIKYTTTDDREFTTTGYIEAPTAEQALKTMPMETFKSSIKLITVTIELAD